MDIFDVFVHQNLQRQIAETRREGAKTDDLVDELVTRMERLETVNAALWSLLKQKLDLSDDEMKGAIRLTRERAHTAPSCPACGRKLLVRNAPNCSWCGESLIG